MEQDAHAREDGNIRNNGNIRIELRSTATGRGYVVIVNGNRFYAPIPSPIMQALAWV